MQGAFESTSAAQLGGGRALALAVTVGILVGVRLQPWLARLPEQLRGAAPAAATTIPAGDIL